MDPIPAIWNAKSHTQFPTEKLHGAKVSDAWHHVKNGEFTAFYIEEDWERVGKFISNRIITDAGYINDIYKNQKKAGQALVFLSHEIRALGLKEKTLDELFILYEQIEVAWVNFDHINVIPWFIGGDYAQLYVHNELTSSYKLNSEDLTTLLTPSKPSFSAEEELGIFKAASNLFLGKNIETDVDKLIEKYYWIPFGYDGPIVYDKAHYNKTINDIVASKTKQDIQNKIDQLEKYEIDLATKQSEIYKKYSIPSSVKKVIESIHSLALMTDERKEYAFQAHEAFYRVISEIAFKLGVEVKILKYVLLDEIKYNISNPNKIVSIGKERIDGLFLVHWKNGKCEILEKDEAEKISAIAIPNVEQVAEIKGQIGCRGPKNKTTGKVKLLLSSLEIDKLEQGEILVTTMTSPEFVPAMRKSLAIITDEGGITCHAAIVSRELNISCVIGTKVATKVLKNGDMVEIDTDKGIIRILK